MTQNLFMSAVGYFSNNFSNRENNLIGETVEIGNVKLGIKRLIAEGGFGSVFEVQAIDSGMSYAVKRMLAADKEANKVILQEINTLKKLSGHPNIVKYLATGYTDRKNTLHGKDEYMLLTDLCSGGCLVDVISKMQSDFHPSVVLNIFYQTCLAVKHMHSQQPPIIHRDIKIENLLIGGDMKIKLCDFGSVTEAVVQPDVYWSAQQRLYFEEEMCSRTTPMYRAPEMLDLWNNYEIGPAVDIWSLGCILYVLCYRKHPFEDAAKLRIINAKFTLPQVGHRYVDFQPLIVSCLKVDPKERISICQLLDGLASIAEARNYTANVPLSNDDLRPSPISTSDVKLEALPTEDSSNDLSSNVIKNHNGTETTGMNSSSGAHQVAGLFSQIRGGAGSFLKNIKDTSSKVVHSVQSSMMTREIRDCDLTYVTSRLCVMSYPGEGVDYTPKCNQADTVRALLQSKHYDSHYCVYNCSGRNYPASRIGHGKLVVGNWGNTPHTPLLAHLYTMCENMYNYLQEDPKNVCVIHCADGKSSSAVLACCFLLFVKFALTPEDAAQMFAVRKIPPIFYNSDYTYLRYFSSLTSISTAQPHFHPLKLISLTMHPVPIFTKARDGCRPYIEVYEGVEKIFTTQLDYDRIPFFAARKRKVFVSLGVTVLGDITIVAYHARYTIGRTVGIKMFQFQFHTGFVSADNPTLVYGRNTLDDISADTECYQSDNFAAVLCFDMLETCNEYPVPWNDYLNQRYVPDVLFSNHEEAQQTRSCFGSKAPSSEVRIHRRPAPPLPSPLSQSTLSELRRSDQEDENVSDSLISPSSKSSNSTAGEDSVRFDLLNLGESSSSTAAFSTEQEENLKSQSNVDLLSQVAQNSSTNSNVFDPFGLLQDEIPAAPSDVSNSSTIPQWFDTTNASSIHRNVSTPDFFPDPFDEFLDGVGTSIESPYLKPSPTNSFDTLEISPTGISARSNNVNPQYGSAPNYSRSQFDIINEAELKGCESTKGGDIFGELLGSQGYEFSGIKNSQGPKTINEMRKVEMTKETDADKLKVRAWVEGKTKNIRALLSTMHVVTWAGCNWQRCEMHQMVTAADVKKAYRKACLAVHPDKHGGTVNENLAKLIFVELNTAWSNFESDASQQNLFQ